MRSTAQAGAIGLLRVLASAQQMLNDGRRVRTDVGRPVTQPLRIPALGDSQVLRGHVHVDRGVVPTASAFAVSGNALAAMEDLDGVGYVTHVDLFARIAVRGTE